MGPAAGLREGGGIFGGFRHTSQNRKISRKLGGGDFRGGGFSAKYCKLENVGLENKIQEKIVTKSVPFAFLLEWKARFFFK